MARQRLVKPTFFQHRRLADAEMGTGLPLRLAYIGLWCIADCRGVFRWDCDTLKLNILPWDDVEMDAVMYHLADGGWLVEYEVGGRKYGWIPTLAEHQTFHKHERPSKDPAPPDTVVHGVSTVPAPTKHGVSTPSTDTGTGTVAGTDQKNNEAAGAARTDETPMQQVMGCLRRIAYAPDGKPPEGYTERRDGSIAKRKMAAGTSAAELCDVIEGVALLRDDGELPWLPRGTKFTLRAVYHTRSGAVPVHTLGLNYLDKRGQAPRKRAPDAPGAPLGHVQGLVGDVLAHIGGRAS